MSRYIAITDIHGELDKLESVLSKLETRPDDIFVFMGDYIDRGSKSKEVVDRVIEQANYNKCIYLIGSHEYAMMRAKTDEYYGWTDLSKARVERLGRGYYTIYFPKARRIK